MWFEYKDSVNGNCIQWAVITAHNGLGTDGGSDNFINIFSVFRRHDISSNHNINLYFSEIVLIIDFNNDFQKFRLEN